MNMLMTEPKAKALSNEVVRRFTDLGVEYDLLVCVGSDSQPNYCGEEFRRPTMRGVNPFVCPSCHTTPSRKPRNPAIVPIAQVAVEPARPLFNAFPRHFQYQLIAAIIAANVHVFLVGPAGSGKTTVASQVAKAMGLEFYAESGHELMTAYDLLGFKSAIGEFVGTTLCDAIEHGGVFLMDEMDAMNPAALVAVNNIAALKAGDTIRIGGRSVEMHEDFHLIGGGNTFGRGANGAYVTRVVIDAATLDRFATVEFGYDAHLEFLSAGVNVPSAIPANPRYKRGHAASESDITNWVIEVQSYRYAFAMAGIENALVTPRATIYGAKMLRAGIHADYVLATLIRKGLSSDEWASVKAHIA